jgi:hypothetical protein
MPYYCLLCERKHPILTPMGTAPTCSDEQCRGQTYWREEVSFNLLPVSPRIPPPVAPLHSPSASGSLPPFFDGSSSDFPLSFLEDLSSDFSSSFLGGPSSDLPSSSFMRGSSPTPNQMIWSPSAPDEGDFPSAAGEPVHPNPDCPFNHGACAASACLCDQPSSPLSRKRKRGNPTFLTTIDGDGQPADQLKLFQPNLQQIEQSDVPDQYKRSQKRALIKRVLWEVKVKVRIEAVLLKLYSETDNLTAVAWFLRGSPAEHKEAIESLLGSRCPEVTRCTVPYLPAYLGAPSQALTDEQRKAVKDVLSLKCFDVRQLMFSPQVDLSNINKTYLSFIEVMLINLHRHRKFKDMSDIITRVFQYSNNEQIAGLFRLKIDTSYGYVVEKPSPARELNSVNMKNSIIVQVLVQDKNYFAINILAIVSKNLAFPRLLIGAVWLYLWEQTPAIRNSFYGQEVTISQTRFPAQSGSVLLADFQRSCPVTAKPTTESVKNLAMHRPASPAVSAPQDEHLQSLLGGKVEVAAAIKINKINMIDYKIAPAKESTACAGCRIFYHQESLFILSSDTSVTLSGKICPLCDTALQAASPYHPQ